MAASNAYRFIFWYHLLLSEAATGYTASFVSHARTAMTPLAWSWGYTPSQMWCNSATIMVAATNLSMNLSITVNIFWINAANFGQCIDAATPHRRSCGCVLAYMNSIYIIYIYKYKYMDVSVLYYLGYVCAMTPAVFLLWKIISLCGITNQYL